MKKENLYFGHYYDTEGIYILKIGTTNNLERRRKEHTYNYHKNKLHPMPLDMEFVYDAVIPLSKYNTLRYEDKLREQLKLEGIGEYIRNDRFLCKDKPNKITFKIRKLHEITL